MSGVTPSKQPTRQRQRHSGNRSHARHQPFCLFTDFLKLQNDLNG
ncbi:hypothetical protein L579_3182 [Pantoea sp. AS-PWVM4]|nr:hypothetical protein L579_3182 [Pantoea sp. AS-PWVM4]